MQRRSNKITGCVNFPILSSEWKSSSEGGLVVKLVVCDDRDFDDQFSVCCGAGARDILNEVLLSDDLRPKPDYTAPESIEEWNAQQQAVNAWSSYHFPSTENESVDGVERYLSREYLAVITLGTTGWSGWRELDSRYWSCTFEDLNEDGKSLYMQIKALYPGCSLHLLTFLDT